MADHQEQKNHTVTAYPVDCEKALLPVSWPPPITTIATTTVQTPQPKHKKEDKSKTWKDFSWKQRVVTVILTVGVVVLMLLYIFSVIFLLGQFRPPTFKVDSLRVNPFNISSSLITADWSIIFSITNPNYEPLSQYYKDVTASIFYEDKSISSTTIVPFFTNLDGETFVPANIGVSSEYINGSIADKIATDRSNGAVKFTVTVNATVMTHPATTREQQISLNVSCEEIEIRFSSDTKNNIGIMLYGSWKCKSHWVPNGFYFLN